MRPSFGKGSWCTFANQIRRPLCSRHPWSRVLRSTRGMYRLPDAVLLSRKCLGCMDPARVAGQYWARGQVTYSQRHRRSVNSRYRTAGQQCPHRFSLASLITLLPQWRLCILSYMCIGRSHYSISHYATLLPRWGLSSFSVPHHIHCTQLVHILIITPLGVTLQSGHTR